MDAGNFTGLNLIYDPTTTVANPNGSGYIRTQYTNNQIPSTEFNALGQSILAMYPLPNTTGNANNYRSEVTNDLYNSNAIFRGDVQLTDKSSMFGRFALTEYNLTSAAVLPSPAGEPIKRLVPTRALGYGYTHTFSTNMVNEVRLSWDRTILNEACLTPLNPLVPGMLDPKINCGTANVCITGYTAIATQPSCCSNTPLYKSSGVWDLSDNLSKSIGQTPAEGRGRLSVSPLVYDCPQFRPGNFDLQRGFHSEPAVPVRDG